MLLSESLYEALEASLKNLERPHSSIQSIGSVSGGDINRAYRIKTSTGDYFVKVNNDPLAASMFLAESNGLDILRNPLGAAHVPKTFLVGNARGEGFLLMEWIDTGNKHDAPQQEALGRLLASLHRRHADAYGLDHDNFIGPLPQNNGFSSDWTEFFIEQRLQKQLDMADQILDGTDLHKKFDRLFSRFADLYPCEPPSLLHGDLWSGNYLVDQLGTPVFIDPAVYYGNREVDIAMTKLFGGFSERFYDAYNETYPLQHGWEERVDLWNLYPLLVHLNLFGRSYLRAIQNNLKQYIGANS
ncbi:fructosamine kinase family protein [Parapedobacter indicus]|uniref:Fructosamine-3-kinase n=1 Tax=Parapedobacter indicus TaxID=1477437 RepID=A0A1I3EX79_9SPHI|nr:fructosamine kinase family protein [Parapedobacter indicus]PPL03459.1 fructosamine-3-kinase [Parapedobacter indicus]SFI03655.1 Fructosamine-3-kinase [Parapedobacter indicus]